MRKFRATSIAVLIGAVLLAANWAIFIHLARQSEHAVAEASAQQARQASIYFREHVEGVFRYADSYTKAVRKKYVENGGSLTAVREFMELFPLDQSILSHVTIIDADGAPILNTEKFVPGATSATDRKYFQDARDLVRDDVVVSETSVGRLSMKTILRVARRITWPDGGFGGVAFTAVEAERLVELVKSLALGPAGLGTLAGTDRIVRARYAGGRFESGQDISVSQLWTLVRATPSGHYIQTSPIDNIRRHFYYQKLDDFPLTATIGVAERDIATLQGLATRTHYLMGGAGSLLIVTMIAFTLRQVRGREKLETASAALRESEAQLRLIADNMPVEINYTDRDNIIRFANKAYARRHGYDNPADMVGRSRQEIWGDDDHSDILPGIEETLRGKVTVYERQRVMPNGEQRCAMIMRAPQRLGSGAVVGYVSIAQDITERKNMEAALAQAQKMEAIGQLTGGIAHDFNNLLAVIMGNAELLGGGDGNATREVATILRAAKRGAELTQRLLAFSRRQPLQPRNVHLPDLIDGMMDLLKRTLGETIRIQSRVDGEVPPVTVDPGQLENAILNLAINSRDAMEKGGVLTVALGREDLKHGLGDSSEHLEPGIYAVITVTDSGCGMAEDVRQHAIEPFFTTKDIGRGSGLGLSMAYGFVRQSGGYLTIDSEPGDGTTVRIYLPRAAAGAAAEPAPAPDAPPPLGLGEKVLVVEDDAEVLDLVSSQLKSLHYAVVTAADGETALARLERGEKFDVLISDVVLGGSRSGTDLVAIVETRWPDCKILLMSGYPASPTGTHAPMELGDRLLGKPFTRARLARKLREILDR